jgi:putative transposase
MGAYRDLAGAGVSTRQASALTGLPRCAEVRDRARPTLGPIVGTRPANALSAQEKDAIVAALTSDDLVDRAPAQAYALLLEQGRYLGSVSTMYRVLAEREQVVERRRQARHPAKKRPELVADGPGQVYSWDITKLKTPVKGVYYDAYVMIDIYSRMIIGVHVHNRESGLLAAEMMREVFGVHGIPHVVHADRGTAMTSKNVTDLLSDLDIDPSYSRPKVSNDNPYSEAGFKTLKYSPWFPEHFTDLDHARQFMTDFADWYNTCHHHSGIGLLTPADVHYGRHHQIQADRLALLEQARQAHPERFTAGRRGLPKALRLPEKAWINKPEDPNTQPPAETGTKATAA